MSDPESLSLTQLRVVLAVVRNGGITQASEALGYLNASSVAYHIDRLEQKLGVPLFEHRGRKLEATELTRTICATADQVCRLVDNLRDNVELLLKGQSGRLRIGCSTMTSSIAKKLNEQLREQYSAIRAEIRQYWCSDEVRAALVAREINVGLLCSGEEGIGELPVVACEERLMAVVGRCHRFFNQPVIDLRRLSTEVVIISDVGPDGDTLIAALSQHALVTIKSVVKVATLSGTVERVQAGHEIGVLPESTIIINGLGAIARPLSVDGEDVRRRIAICTSADSAIHPVIQRVIQVLQRETLKWSHVGSVCRVNTA